MWSMTIDHIHLSNFDEHNMWFRDIKMQYKENIIPIIMLMHERELWGLITCFLPLYGVDIYKYAYKFTITIDHKIV